MICIPWTLNSNALKLAANGPARMLSIPVSFKLLFWGSFHPAPQLKLVPVHSPFSKLVLSSTDGKERDEAYSLVLHSFKHWWTCAVPRLNWNQLVLLEHFRTKSSPPRLEKGELLMQLLTKSVVLSVGFDPIALWVEQSCCLKQGQSRHKPFWSYFTKICWPIFLNLQLACFKRGIPFFQLCLSPPFEI